ncbi:MAG TPA: carbohydrate-binding protein [Thermoanaerobaculia bacterium]|nr:carbohydrate-binding protein [Thermoanaerobaculia bacterium]
MKKKFFLVPLLLGFTALGLSASPISPERLDALLEAGWTEARPGVMQRILDNGTVETLGYGEDGLRFRLTEMKEHLAFLKKELARQPSTELRKAIRSYQAEIRRVQKSLQTGGSGSLASSAEGLVAGTGCTANYDGIASVLPLTKGASAEADAYFENGCGYTGEVYAHAYAKATSVANEVVTMTLSDPGPNLTRVGANVAASATVTVNGVKDCYAYSYASVTSYDLALTYSVSATNSTCPQQTTFRGTPFTVPGMIKAADFDNGGEGIAYHEATPSSGQVYRSTGMDLYEDNVLWLEPGEWLEYTIDVVTPGTYSVIAQVSAAGVAGGPFHIELDGVNVTGPLTIPAMPTWGDWSSITKEGVSFPAGRHVLRMVADSGFSGFYSLRIVPALSPFGGTPRALPGSFYAADFDEGGEQMAYHDTTAGCDGSCGHRLADVDRWEGIVFRTRTGEWMKYTVNVTTAGTYNLVLRVAAQSGGALFHVEFDGVNVTGPLTMPTTGAWENFQTLTKTGVSLTAGRKVMRVVIDDGHGNYDAGSFEKITLQP